MRKATTVLHATHAHTETSLPVHLPSILHTTMLHITSTRQGILIDDSHDEQHAHRPVHTH